MPLRSDILKKNHSQFSKKNTHKNSLPSRVAVFFMFFLLLVIFFNYWRPWEKISSVHVSSVNIPEQNVKKVLKIDSGSYRWQVVGQEIFLVQRLKIANDKITDVDFKLLGQKLEIIVHERVNAGFFLQNGQWYELDSQARKLKVDKPNGIAPIYTGFKEDQQRSQVAKSFTTLNYAIRHNVSEIIFAPDKNNNQKIILVMNDGNTVYASIRSFADKMKYYPSIVAQMNDKGVIDLQYGSYSYAYGNKSKE